MVRFLIATIKLNIHEPFMVNSYFVFCCNKVLYCSFIHENAMYWNTLGNKVVWTKGKYT